MKKLFTLISAMVLSSMLASAQLIYTNGTIVNQPGAGFGGADVSALHDGLGSLGLGHQFSFGYRIADDFTIPAGETWTIDSIIFLAYQTNSGNISPFTAVNCAIYSGSPATGGTIVLGDETTNILDNTYFSGIYRTSATTLTAVTRPVMRNCVIPQTAWSLTAGNYWFSWQTDGDAALTGPWAPPLTDAVNTVTGDGLQYNPDSMMWFPANDGSLLTQQGFPFEVYGTVVTGVNYVEQDNYLSVTPNPSNGNFTLVADFTKAANLEINVTDLRGRNVYNEKINDVITLNKKISLKDIPAGVYLLKLYRESGDTIIKKIVLE